jgi:hypothetical protein
MMAHALGAAILTGVDYRLESIMTAAMPDWLTSFATALSGEPQFDRRPFLAR